MLPCSGEKLGNSSGFMLQKYSAMFSGQMAGIITKLGFLWNFKDKMLLMEYLWMIRIEIVSVNFFFSFTQAKFFHRFWVYM